tara:strand:+ start:1528 stop:2277 length:750 start_codon:yes stop_codon:yes gene_type:complete
MIKAVIIDDEERARRVIRNLLKTYCAEVEVIATCSSIPEAVIAINEHEPNVVFCDIQMPDYSGFDLLKFFQDPKFELIFATGFQEYAIKAFEVSAIDYLLKPIQIEKLENAIEKVKKRLHAGAVRDRLKTLELNLDAGNIQKVALPVSDGLVFIAVEEIDLLEADGAYTQVYLTNKTSILVSKKLRYFEDLLEGISTFFRVHRSHIINIDRINKYSKAESYLYLANGMNIKIARDKKAEFEAHISSIRL